MRHRGADNIAHAWAHGHDRPKGYSNHSVLYESGSDTIYSYGRHFPMAKHYEGKVLLTLKTYSNTTAGHLSAVRSAISHMEVIECWVIPGAGRFSSSSDSKKDTDSHNENIRHWIKQIELHYNSLEKARKKSIWLERIDEERKQAQAYIDLFKLKLKAKDRKLLFEADLSVFVKQAIKEQEKLITDRMAKDKKADEVHEQWLPLWKSFDVDGINAIKNIGLLDHAHSRMEDGNAAWLRADDKNVFTSKGITIPIPVAERYFKRYMEVVGQGGCVDCPEKMMDFQVKYMSYDKLVVGCHSISRAEIDYIAFKLGWDKPFDQK